MPAQTQNFERHLANIARGYASMVTRLAKQYAPNNHLRTSIRSWTENKGVGYYIIRTQASGPDARAREYGSGIWARRGPKGKILIQAKNKFIKGGRGPFLIFKWDVATSPVSGFISNVPQTKDNVVLLKKVEHPGVEAAREGRGYLGPAMNDTRKAMREKLKKEGATAIRADLRANFRTRA